MGKKRGMSRGDFWTTAALFLIGLLPILLYCLIFGFSPSVSPARAMALMRKQEALLVDVRRSDEFESQHIPEAIRWPLDQIQGVSDLHDLPAWTRGKPLLLICTSGYRSVRAARHLKNLGRKDIINVSGGIQKWIAVAGKIPGSRFCLMRGSRGRSLLLPEKPLTLVEQLAMVAVGYAIKPFYMLLALGLAVILHRKAIPSPDIRAAKWSLIAFFSGEAACTINYTFFAGLSFFWEYLHSFGMVVAFTFFFFALFAAFDNRLFHFSSAGERCAAITLCRRCYKTADVTCRFSWLFFFFSLAGLVLSFIPLSARPQIPAYNTKIFATFYHFSNPVVYQLFESRFCPLVAIPLFLFSAFLLFRGRQSPPPLSKKSFAVAAGFLGFSLFRLFLFHPFIEHLTWFTFWEEATEWLFIAGVAAVLWLFRGSLFVLRKEAGSTTKPHAVPEDFQER